MKISPKGFSGHVYNTLHRLSQDGGTFTRKGWWRWGLSEWKRNPPSEDL